MSTLIIKARGFSCNRNVNQPVAILGVITLGVIGSIVFLLLPMLIGAFSEKLSLSAAQVGLLGSADMIGMFIAAIVATGWIRNYNWRVIAALACSVLIVCHILSGFVQSFAALSLIRIIAGFAGGSLMSIALTSLGDTRQPDRFFALFIAGQLTLGGLGLWLFPGLLAQFGLGGVFGALTVVVLGTTLFIPFIPQQGRKIEPAVTSPRKGRAVNQTMMPGLMALLACIIFNLGVMAVWAYLERMGNAAGLEASFIGSALAVSLAGALVGALLAAVIANRFGRVIPLIITLVVQLIALLLLGGELSRNAFLVGVMLFAFAWNFPVPYQLAITVSMDVSGRLVVLFLSAVKLGYAAAPVIAAQLIMMGRGFTPVVVLAGAGFVTSALIFVLLTMLPPRQELTK